MAANTTQACAETCPLIPGIDWQSITKLWEEAETTSPGTHILPSVPITAGQPPPGPSVPKAAGRDTPTARLEVTAP